MGKHSTKKKLTKAEKKEKAEQETVQKMKELSDLEVRMNGLYLQNNKIVARIRAYERY